MNLEPFLIVVAVKVLNSLLPLHSINIRVLNGSISQIKKFKHYNNCFSTDQ